MEQFVHEGSSVVFHFNPGLNVIGLEITMEESPNAYRIRTSRDGKLGHLSARAFLKFYSIKHDQTQSYEAKVDDKTGFVLIELRRKGQKEGLK
jgi:hypothetical protein